MSRFDYAIAGGGLIGLATALKIQAAAPRTRVVVLEKEPQAGMHQSTHNSGVLHCGLYYKPGSMKARMAVEGIVEMIAFCERHGIPHEVCGKVVVATNALEESRLDDLYSRGQANGLRGLVRLDQAGLRRIEPHAAGRTALLVPQEGIVDYRAVCDTMVRLIRENNGEVRCGHRVVKLEVRPRGWVVGTSQGEIDAGFFINCGGLHCDRVARLAGEVFGMQIVPFRGEYYELAPSARGLVRHLIYPVPDPAFPFLGVHFTRLIHGGVECGPNAVLAFSREGYRFSQINPVDLAQTLAFSGLWRFLRRYPRMAWQEFAQSLSRGRFCRALQKLIPEVREDDLVPGGAGVRAQAMTRRGDLVQDFHLLHGPRSIHVLNAPSPGATASLTIGNHIAQQARIGP
jgi:(S)-2-hydroxyglutarate dehydrogenase